MSDPASPAPSGGGEVVRGDGNLPGQGPGEAMPSVTTNERKSLSDFKSAMAEKNNGPARGQGQPPPARSRLGQFSESLERTQQRAVMPNQARDAGQEIDEREPPEHQQLAEPDPDAPQKAKKPEEQEAGASENATPEPMPEPKERVSSDDREALAKYRQWETDDMFPPELEGKLHEVKINGQTKYVDTREMRQGYMRGGDYRRAYSQLQQKEQAGVSRDKAIQEHFDAINDPNQMLEIYERNGYGNTLEQLADIIHARKQERQQIIEGAGIAAMRALGLSKADWNHRDVVNAMYVAEQRLLKAHQAEIQSRSLEFERSRFQQSQQQVEQQAKVAENSALYERQLTQLRPNAFRAYGLADSAGNRQALVRHLRDVIATEGFKGEITRGMVMSAASSLKDELEDARSSERNADRQPARPAGQPLPPNRIAAGGGAPMGNLGGKTRGSLSDLEAMVKRGRMQ